jgi:DNA polymerase-4
MNRVVFHADLDAFFASVEQLDRPELRGEPVVVGALPGHRGVVSACSYEARAFGVRSAMPISRAAKLCPGAAFLPVRMARYRELSERIMAIFGEFSPEVRQISVDEAFLDMSGTGGLFGPPAAAARALKDRVRAETGLSVSVGVASNRYLAKLASARSKPDGLLVVESGSEEAFMAALPLEKVWGIGEKTLERLRAIGLDTVERIRGLPRETLRRAVGDALGDFLYAAVRGEDPGIMGDERKSRSISGETTYEHDVADPEVLEATVLALSQELMFRLIGERLSSRTVHVKIRYDDFETLSAQETLDRPVATAEDIRSAALALLGRKRDPERAVRLLGVGLGNVEDEDPLKQGELFADGSSRLAAVERAVLDLKRKKGALVTRARLVRPRGDAD